jgi:hypothetical protein
VLTNTGTATDTFSVNVLSSEDWPVSLLSETHSTETQELTLELGAQISAALQVSLTVPSYVRGVTEVTLITATSQLSPTVQDAAIDTTFVPATVYLPMVMRRWPPIPYQPTLHSIDNPDGDGSYTASWTEQPSRLADTYTLEEATNSAFTGDLREVCTTAGQSCDVTGRTEGTYYYRVRGHNSWGDGPYSGVESVAVLAPATPTIQPIANDDGDGDYAVAWSATARATWYQLLEDTDPGFGGPQTVHEGAANSWQATDKTAGTYYYRVRALGPTGHSEWSGTQVVTVLPPDTPTLNPIDNADQDQDYSVTWSPAARATWYQLQEDTDSDFGSPQTVYEGAVNSRDATGKTPGTYYYRLRALGPTGHSAWSESRQITIYPLFVGLELRWDGEGYVRGTDYYDIGWHQERDCNGLTDGDTIRCHTQSWYSPNPLGFDSESWDSYYSVSTGHFKSSSSPADPSWKWGYPWALPYEWAFTDGDTFRIWGQRFKVTGPHWGYTAFGRAVHYWKLVNKDRFLFWDGGGSWRQYVRKGDAVLHYDAGNTRLLLHDDILRTFYYEGDRTNETVQYIANLTSASAFPSQPTNSGLSHLQREALRTGRGLSFRPQPTSLEAPLRTTTRVQTQRPPMGWHERAAWPKRASRR